MRKRLLGLTVAAALVSPAWVIAPAAQAADCQALQNAYAAANAAALKRAGQLQISDSDFASLRDELQRLGADGELTSQELTQLTVTNAAARKLATQFTDSDQTLIQNLIKTYNTFEQSCQGDPDKAAPAEVPNTPTTKATATPSPTTEATAAPSTGGQVTRVPNDAPETGDGSTDILATPDSIAAQIVAYVVGSLVAGLGIFTALRRDDAR